MRINSVDSPSMVLRFFLLGIFMFAPLGMSLAQEADEAAKSDQTHQLTAENLAILQSALAEMQALAPKLRVLLRSLHSQVGFDSREIFNIERGINQSQKDMERLVAMHQRGAVNPMRAHFLADDLRRKADAMRDSLAYVVQQNGQLKTAPDDQAGAAVSKENDDLREHLARYSEMLDQSVEIFKQRQL
jgi:hypothetical protein